MAPSEPGRGRSTRRERRRRGGFACAPGRRWRAWRVGRESRGRAEHGEGDAGVAAGGVEEGLAGDEQTAGAGVAHHGGRGAVFDASAGVGPLGFGQKRDALEAMHRPLKTDRAAWSRYAQGARSRVVGGVAS